MSIVFFCFFCFFCFFSSGEITSQRSGVTIVAKKMIFVLTTNAGADDIVNVYYNKKAVSSDETKRILENSKVLEDAELRWVLFVIPVMLVISVMKNYLMIFF